VSEALHPQLAGVIAEFDAATADARRLADSLDDAAFARRPAPDRWSPAECIAHLTITTDVYLPIIRDAVTRAKAMPGARGRYRCDWKGWLLARSLEPSARFKIKTPPRFEPRDLGAKANVMNDFVRSQEALEALVRESSGRDLRRVKIVSPFSAKMSYNMYSCFKILTAHERRHLAQAREGGA